jgi:hypothetical protein
MPEKEPPTDASTESDPSDSTPAAAPERRPLPNGYRQGIVSAVTIFIGFSLAFLRFWAFEAPGHWTLRALLVALLLAVPILLEIYVLFRSLRVADDDETEYAETIRWFVISVVAMLIAIVVAAVLPH